jgi:hypothetical protein
MDRPIKNRVNLTNGFTLTIISVICDIVLRYHRNSRCLILGPNCRYPSRGPKTKLTLSQILMPFNFSKCVDDGSFVRDVIHTCNIAI